MKIPGRFMHLLMLVLVFGACNNPKQNLKTDGKPEGTAILITGAAARIPQEAALLEQLQKTGQLKNVVFIGGASSGALNAVILNGIISKKINFRKYSKWLSEITNNDVFTRGDKTLPVSTEPLKILLEHIVNDSLKYYKIKDLPVTTAISVTETNLLDLPKKNYRLSNKKINAESDPELDIIDVLMASTAFPVVFPEQRIRNITSALPDKNFIDGGLSEDHVPYRGLIDFINFRGKGVEKIIIVSRKSDLGPDISEELKNLGISDNGYFDRLGISLDEILLSGFLKSLNAFQETAPELARITDVYVPEFDEKFLLLDFNNLKKQYDVTQKWAKKNKPVPLAEFLKKNQPREN